MRFYPHQSSQPGFCWMSFARRHQASHRSTPVESPALFMTQSGASVPGVPVRATNEDTGVVTTTVSQETGDYLVNFLIPGTYRVEAEKTGFQKSVYTGVIVNAGGISRIDVNLRIGETRQQVEVAASTIVVATETSELSQTFSNKELDTSAEHRPESRCSR